LGFLVDVVLILGLLLPISEDLDRLLTLPHLAAPWLAIAGTGRPSSRSVPATGSRADFQAVAVEGAGELQERPPLTSVGELLDLYQDRRVQCLRLSFTVPRAPAMALPIASAS
ncbi:MAG: hypothetical protein ACTHJI_18230, partial [Leifsonia sp.]